MPGRNTELFLRRYGLAYSDFSADISDRITKAPILSDDRGNRFKEVIEKLRSVPVGGAIVLTDWESAELCLRLMRALGQHVIPIENEAHRYVDGEWIDIYRYG